MSQYKTNEDVRNYDIFKGVVTALLLITLFIVAAMGYGGTGDQATGPDEIAGQEESMEGEVAEAPAEAERGMEKGVVDDRGGREAALRQDLADEDRPHRGEAGRLEHEGAADGERRRDLVRREVQGEVEGGDDGPHAVRLEDAAVVVFVAFGQQFKSYLFEQIKGTNLTPKSTASGNDFEASSASFSCTVRKAT